MTDIREVQGEENLDSIEHFTDENIDGYQSQTRELRYILKNMNKKNYIEFYHDALQYNEDLTMLFNLGHIDLKERAIVEDMFNKICKNALYFLHLRRSLLKILKHYKG